ncbi:hypothetical protein JTB14_023954 [Gonioctena quinquepunctata]|nr:hypothetical protein JTB14_023954 [Gonioctena quinquepunctata]
MWALFPEVPKPFIRGKHNAKWACPIFPKIIPCVRLSDHAPIPNKWKRAQLVREARRRQHPKTELFIWLSPGRANPTWPSLRNSSMMCKCRDKELANIRPWEGINLISVDPNRFRLQRTVIQNIFNALERQNPGPTDGGDAVSVEDESAPAKRVDRQPSAETCHTAKEGSETEALFDPEDVSLTEVDQDGFPTKSSRETGSQGQLHTNRGTRLPNGGLFLLLLRAHETSASQNPARKGIHGPSKQKAQGTRYKYISYPRTMRGIGRAGRIAILLHLRSRGSLFYCTSEA